MLVLAIGGPLDGELREVGDTVEGLRFVGGYAGFDRVPLDYHIANGIARHESVSAEEVARRVALWRKSCLDFGPESMTFSAASAALREVVQRHQNRSP